MTILKGLLLSLAFAAIGLAQPSQVQVNADCVIAFNITTVGTRVPANGYANGNLGCNSWQIQYWNNGFSGLSLRVESAPNTATTFNTCTPGSWGSIGGTLVFGVNPNTNTTQASSLIQAYGTSFASCVSVTLTSATGAGNVTGVLLGFRSAGLGGTTTSAASSVTITSPVGQQAMASGVSVTLANNQISGAQFTHVNLSGSGNTQLVAASGSTKIYVLEVDFATGSGEDVKFTEGTGSNCAIGTADVTGLYKNIVTFSFGNGVTGLPYTATGGDALCVNQSVAQAAGVTVWYLQQ